MRIRLTCECGEEIVTRSSVEDFKDNRADLWEWMWKHDKHTRAINIKEVPVTGSPMILYSGMPDWWNDVDQVVDAKRMEEYYLKKENK